MRCASNLPMPYVRLIGKIAGNVVKGIFHFRWSMCSHCTTWREVKIRCWPLYKVHRGQNPLSAIAQRGCAEIHSRVMYPVDRGQNTDPAIVQRGSSSKIRGESIARSETLSNPGSLQFKLGNRRKSEVWPLPTWKQGNPWVSALAARKERKIQGLAIGNSQTT